MGKPTQLQTPVPLEKSHDFATFDCGTTPLNDYLRKYAYQNQQNRSARTYVVLRAGHVVGYYTLAAGSVERAETPERVAKRLANYPVPIFLLARLAVDQAEKGKGKRAWGGSTEGCAITLRSGCGFGRLPSRLGPRQGLSSTGVLSQIRL